MIKISVIIPIYNVEKYLSICLDSVLGQTLKDIELICVNDGSPDKCLDILKEYAQKDSRIIIIDQINKGAAEAKNVGLKAAQGQFVIFMDPDDYYPGNDILESLYNAAINNNVKIAGGSMSFFLPDSPVLRQDFCESNIGQTFKESSICDYKDYQFDYGFTRFIYERELLLKNNIDFPPFINFEDPVFFVRAMQAAGKFYALKKNVYAYKMLYKPILYSPVRTKNTLCGLKMNLSFAQEHKLTKLEDYTITRLEEYLDCIKKTLTFSNLYGLYQLAKLNKKARKIFFKMLARFIFSLTKKQTHREIMILGIKFKFKRNKLQNIFSIKNATDTNHKILAILGIKFKFKSQKLMLRAAQDKIVALENDLRNSRNEIDTRIENEFSRNLNNLLKIVPFKNKKIFLFGTSRHDNIGDSAITEAEVSFANRYFPDYQVIECPTYEYDEFFDMLKQIISPDDMIWCSGGGNFGNRYIGEEILRRKVVSNFKDNNIFIFPQSIWFSEDENGKNEIENSRKIYDEHKNLTIFTRDPLSLEFAKKYFSSINSYLFPDIVCSYKYSKQFDRSGILACIRHYKDESGLDKETYETLINKLRNYDLNVDFNENRYEKDDISAFMRHYVVNQQLDNFAKHKLIVTDRLHGVIFSIVTKTPCIVLKSEDHKIPEFIKFLSGYNSIKYLEKDIDQVDSAIDEMLNIDSPCYPDWDKEYFDKFAQLIKAEISRRN